ncbi:MAG: CHASE2 domain-containing protein [Candidatus Methylacidiphilales bacterium]
MSSLHSQNQNKPFSAFYLLAPLLSAALFGLLSTTTILERLENLTLDQRIQIRHMHQESLDPRIFLVGVDDISLEKIGRWPFQRKAHAQLMYTLSHGRPSVFAWDVMFDTYSGANNSVSEDDAFMASACQLLNVPVITAAATTDYVTRTDKAQAESMGWDPGPLVINSSIVESPYLIAPIPELAAHSKVGIVTANRHEDGVVRRIPFVIRTGNRILPSLSLAAIIELWQLNPEQHIRIVPGDAVYIDSPLVKRRIPIDINGYYHINYRYEVEDMLRVETAVSYITILAGYHKKYIDNQSSFKVPDLDGKIILIGQVAAGLADIGRSPLTGLSPLVMTHVNVIDNVLKSDYLILPPAWAVWLGFLIVGYATLILPRNLDFWLKMLIPVVVLALYIGLSVLLFSNINLDLPLAAPGLAFVVLHISVIGRQVLDERRAREELRTTFSAYVAPGILNSIYQNPDALKLGGSKKDVAILFTDIRSFTSMTEVMDSEVLVAQLNEYFTEMVGCINNHGGTLHKFIGDAIMAVWGDISNNSPTLDAGRALQAAIDMRNALTGLNRIWIDQSRPEFKMGIGINFGRVTCGNIGAPQRMEFTVIGDSVNLSARLESLTKKFGVEILVGESMYDLTHERFLFRSIARVQVVGKQEGVQIYEPLCETGKEEQSPYDMNWVRLYEEGYTRYMERRFDVAIRLFEACLNEQPHNKATLILLESARLFQSNPPPKSWNGTFEMTSK